MEVRRSIMHPRLEELGALSPTAPPLRRRSSVSRVAEPVDASENDDDTERHQRRVERRQSQAGEAGKRQSLGLSFVSKMSSRQLAEEVSRCIKLCAENKINVKNAFSLKMIDFMTYMIKKKDSNMSNLQVASTSLDVSTKIYGYRVDGVHTDTLKMTGGLDKQDKRDGRRDRGAAENAEVAGGNAAEAEPQRAKKKKKSKKNILVSNESLIAPLDLINPASMMFDAMSDAQTTDMLYQATLPVHANSDLYLHPYNDVILDTVNPEMEADVNNAPVDCPLLERFGHLDLCPPFANFEFLGWSPEEELDPTPQVRCQPLVENDGFQFDLDASLPVDDAPAPSAMNYFDMEDDDNEKIEGCHRAGPPPAKIVDFSEVVKSAGPNKNFEYSYINENMNIESVGASHWKISYPAKNLGGSRIVEGCAQEPTKRRKDAVLIFDAESSEVAMAKFGSATAKAMKKEKLGWSEEKQTLPSDVDYDDLEFSRYYVRPELIKKYPQKDQMNGTLLPDEVGDYDYNNENDTTEYCPNIENDTTEYCPNIENEDNQAEENCNNGADFEEDVDVATQAFTGDNLVEAPKMTNKIFIPFSQRAKKIDMRALKKAIWKDLVSSEGDNADNINGPKNFSDVFKNLPRTLTKSNAEALSVPIAFISLLHLANEKNLQIDSSDDKIDLHIRQG